MESAGQVFQTVFYVAMVLALGYFAHKVVWFLQFRKIQRRMVERALERLRETTETVLIRWDRAADSSWSEATGGRGGDSPVAYVEARERELAGLLESIRASRRAVKPLFVRMLSGEEQPSPDFTVDVLTVARPRGQAIHVTIRPEFRPLGLPRPPESDLFRLEVRSRYGLVRRLLAFLLGPADVVYSSAHVARMSQNAAVPASVLFRRVSLLVLVVAAIAFDIAFRIRPKLIALSERVIAHRLDVHGPGPVVDFVNANIHTLIGFALWLGGYGLIYTILFLYLFLRSRRNLRLLRNTEKSAPQQMQAILEHHRQQLVEWAADYARSLDEATDITVLQADMLVQRAMDRMRRRLASPELLSLAQRIAHAFFLKLPESSTALADVATQHEHSLAHRLWPREREMRYQVEIAKYRTAWRYLEMTTNDLRGHRPDPFTATELWRNLVAYARMFPEIVASDVAATLEAVRDETFRRLVKETEVDLAELDHRLRELAEGLEHTVGAAPALVASRIQLTDESIEADAARFAADVLRLREEARLEAMAFEI
ncbi:MAG: hypothetical protein U0230_15335 [Polyangiales bacterium]